jgi:hypothetical protein
VRGIVLAEEDFLEVDTLGDLLHDAERVHGRDHSFFTASAATTVFFLAHWFD